MNTLEIFSLICIISLKSFSFQLTVVTYIKKIPSHGKIPQLEGSTIAKTEEKRLQLCRDGFRQIQQYNLWGIKGKAVFREKTAIEKMEIHIFMELDDYKIRAEPAIKCPTDPESYILINLYKENYNQPSFQVLYKQKSPRPVLDRIMYQMMRVIDIIEVEPTFWLSESESSNRINLKEIPIYDTEELTDDQRLQICIKGMQTVPKLNIKLKKDTKTSANKYYFVTKFSKWDSRTYDEIVEAFECPTEPKIYISIGEELSKMDRWSTMTRREFPKIGLLWVVVKTVDGDRKLTALDKLEAFSLKETAEALYHQIRANDKDTKIDQVIDLKEQTRICRSIFKDFLYKRESWIDQDNTCRILNFDGFRDVYDELKTENTNLCERYYKSSDSVFISGQDIVVLNGPESIDVKAPETGESVSEDLFVCFIRTGWRGTEEYFFSKKYNVNFDSKNSDSDYIAGRFYFKRDSNDSVVMMGLVEEFAKVLETPNVEMLFLERRKRREVARTDSDDPLCKLKRIERSRVCSIVFEFGYEASTPLYNLGCTKNPITLTTNEGLKEANGNQYDEWMISCYETVPEYGSFKVYYLSQAYDKSNPSSSSDVFAYKRTAGSEKILLQKAYTDPRIGHLLTKK